MYSKNNKLKVFTAFSGYDSQCLALNRLRERHPDFDYEIVGWSEIDQNAIKAHDILFPEAKDRNYGDISKIDWSEVDDFDLFTYSSPCFVAGTKVLTTSGLKNIEDVRPGDSVLTHMDRFRTVTDAMSREYTGKMNVVCVKKTPEDNAYIRCTANHPFWSIEPGHPGKYAWTPAENLTKDHQVCVNVFSDVNHYSKWVHPEFVSSDVVREPVTVYNLEVDEDESYTADGVFVHNCTDFSLAGSLGGGEEGSGTRSSLLWECRRCIMEKRPKYLLLENVTNLVSKRFYDLFQKWIDTVASFGYKSFWSTINASEHGIPQNRDRVFLVSVREDSNENAPDFKFPKPSGKPVSVKDFLEDGKDVPDDYDMDYKKMIAWISNNEQKILEYISERNWVEISQIEVTNPETVNIIFNDKTTKQEHAMTEEEKTCDFPCGCTAKEQSLAALASEDAEVSQFDDSFKPTQMTEEERKKPVKPIIEFLSEEDKKIRGKDKCVKAIPTPTRSDGSAPTLMATGYASADYKNFYSVGHFPKLGIFEVWHEHPKTARKKKPTGEEIESNSLI